MTGAESVNLRREIGIGFVAKVIMAVVGFAGTIIFARKLGPVAFGGFYLLLSVIHIVDRPIIGLAGAAEKRASEAHTDTRELLGFQLLATLTSVPIVATGTYITKAYIASYTGLDNVWILFTLLYGVLSLFVSTQVLIVADGRVGVNNLLDLLRSIFTLPAQLAFILTAGLGATGMVYGLATATLLTLPVSLVILGVTPKLPTKTLVRSVWDYARYNIPASLITKTYDRFDMLLIGILLAPGVAGQYQVAYNLSMPGTLLATVAASGMMARVSNLISKDKQAAATENITTTVSHATLLSIPIFFGALALSTKLVVTVYGPAYASASSMLIGLAAFHVIRTQTVPLSSALRGLDRPDIDMKIGAITLTFNILVGIALAHKMGGLGIVIATVLSETIRMISLHYVLKAELPDVTLISDSLTHQLLGGVSMFLVIDLLDKYIAITDWFVLAPLVATGAIIYAVVLYMLDDAIQNAVTETRSAIGV